MDENIGTELSKIIEKLDAYSNSPDQRLRKPARALLDSLSEVVAEIRGNYEQG